MFMNPPIETNVLLILEANVKPGSAAEESFSLSGKGLWSSTALGSREGRSRQINQENLEAATDHSS
jgi:hypothetical protein